MNKTEIALEAANTHIKNLQNKLQHFHNILWNVEDTEYLMEEFEILFNLDGNGKVK